MDTKNEMIKEYGQNVVAYDATDNYKPMLICYIDSEDVLAYDMSSGVYHKCEVECDHDMDNEEDESYFMIEEDRHWLSDYVRVNSAWGNMPNTLDGWEDMNKIKG